MSTEPNQQSASPMDQPGAPNKGARGTDTSGFYKIAVAVLSIIVVGLLAVMSQGSGQSAAPQATVTVTVSGQPGTDGDPEAQQPPAEVDPVEDPERDELLMSLPRREEGDPLAMGDVDATIVMTEWADYRCPFCSVFAEDTLPELQPLIDDGTLRIEFRDLAIFGDDSVNAAAGARAAGQQGLYWEFSGALYASLPKQGKPPVGDDVVTDIASQIGVPDMDKFQTDFKDPATVAAVEADSAEAQGFGITGTPAFLVGTEFISGAQPIEVFETVIASEIDKLN